MDRTPVLLTSWPADRRELHWLFARFDGMIGRGPFWLGSVAIALALGLAEWWLRRRSVQAGAVVLVLTGLAMYPLAALAAKRALDRGRSAFWGVALVLFVVGASLIAGLAAHPAGQALLPLASGMRTASMLAWLILFVDLGLMPGRPPAPDLDRATAALHKPSA